MYESSVCMDGKKVVKHVKPLRANAKGESFNVHLAPGHGENNDSEPQLILLQTAFYVSLQNVHYIDQNICSHFL